MVTVKKAFLLILLLLTTSFSFAAVTAKADRLDLYDDETFILTVSVSPSGQLRRSDISALESIFTIVSRVQSTQASTVNGRRVSTTEHQFRLAPKEIGMLGLPSFTVDNDRSDTFFINVKDSSQRSNNLESDAIEFSVRIDNENPYVDQSINLTIEIAYRVLLQGQFSAFNFTGFEDEVISEDERTETRYGRSYNIYTRTVKLTPRQAGIYVLPDITFLGQYRLSNNQAAKRIDLTAKPPSVNVRPIPASYPAGAYWLPSNGLTLEDNLADSINLEENEHLSWSITQTVIGLSANLLPDPLSKIENDASFQLYRDNPVFNDAALGGTRKDIAALSVNVNAGNTIALPEITIPWWNLKTDKLEYATLPSRTITINASNQNIYVPNNIDTKQTSVTTANEQSNFWRWVSIILAIGLTISLAILVVLLRRNQPQKSMPKAFSEQPETTIPNSVENTYAMLTKLVHQYGHSLMELKSMLPSTELEHLLAIEKHFYGNTIDESCSLDEAQNLFKYCEKMFQKKKMKKEDPFSIYPED